MNIDNINKLINHLKKIGPQNFDMGDWLRGYPNKKKASEVMIDMESKGGCGTVACIAGHAAILCAAESDYDDNLEEYELIEDIARDWLDLDWEDANTLFYRTDPRIKPSDAIPVLESLRDTGVVDWSVAPYYKRD